MDTFFTVPTLDERYHPHKIDGSSRFSFAIRIMIVKWNAVWGRLVPYWTAVLSSLFILSFWYAWTSEYGYDAYEKAIFKPVRMPVKTRSCAHPF
jgi:hypothetical protein